MYSAYVHSVLEIQRIRDGSNLEKSETTVLVRFFLSEITTRRKVYLLFYKLWLNSHE